MAEIDLTPTEEMAANAARGLELRRKHGKGGTEIGVARARDISNRKNLSPETVRRMHAFFSRHEKNKAGGEDDAGYIAWLLWGGDSGQSWAKRKVEQMDKGENERSDTYKEIAQRLGSAAKMAMIPLGTMRRLKKHYDEYVAYLRRSDPKRKPMSFDDFVDEHKEYVENSPMFDPNQFSRPGAKAKFSNGAKNRRLMQVLADADRRIANQVVSNIVKHYGITTQQVFDEIFDSEAEDLMDYVTEPVRSAAYVILQKKGMMSRPGAKAKMNRPVVVDTWNAGHAVVTAELMPDHVGPSGVMHGAMWTGAITAKDRNGSIDRIAFTNPYKNMENAKRALMAEIAKIKASDMWRPRSKNDRLGAKAEMARDLKVRKGNFTDAVAIVGQNGGGSASFYAGLILRHKDGEEQVLWMKHGYSTEKAAERAALQRFDAHVSRMSRPGAKAKFGMTNAGYKALVDAIRVYGDSAPAAVVAQARQMKQEPTEFTDNEVMAVIAKMKQARASRPGAKAKFMRFIDVLSWPGEHGSTYEAVIADDAGRFQPSVTRRDRDGSEQYLTRYAPTFKTEAGARKWLQAKIAEMKAQHRASRPGAKAEMANHIRTVAEDKEASRRGLRRMIDQLESEWQSLNNQPSKAGRIPRMETIKKQIAGLEERLKSLSSRPGAKAKMARWETERTKRWDKPIVEHTANIRGNSFRIEAPEGSSSGTLYLWNNMRGFERIQSGSIDSLKRMAEQMGAKEARGVAAIERRANYSRPGAKVANAVREGEKVSASDDAVSRKIRKLMDEGKPQKQAVAIALDLERRGEL